MDFRGALVLTGLNTMSTQSCGRIDLYCLSTASGSLVPSQRYTPEQSSDPAQRSSEPTER